MAESLVLVCDVCGRPAEQSVTIKVAGRSLVKDLCARHFEELLRDAHTPRRGRRPKAGPPSRAHQGRRLPESPSTAKQPRRRITDPVTLEKRRAALEKARQALAKKRATAKRAS
jgi:hypothetical protein